PLNKFRTNIQYITLFGLLLGGLEALLFWGLLLLFPAWLAWISYWIIDGLITGGFHLDALADTADGFFSSRTPDKIFKIMKDSRIGTMGSLALIYYYLLAISTGIVIIHYLTTFKLVILIAILTMLTKTGLSLLFYKMKYVGNKNGLASVWLNVNNWQIVVAQLFSIIVIFAVFNWQGLLSYLFVVLC
ncbi:adenosylcobinamide-GDP ribazoletransferase, partial [Lactobacillus sp. XV13L]|nr:adenosylcobinamide-GDP ribazoletransferase [Lactobacillus sp. XV13L]